MLHKSFIVFAGYIQLQKMSCIVLDEADSLLDDSFVKVTKNILKMLQVDIAFTYLLIQKIFNLSLYSDILNEVFISKTVNTLMTKKIP